MYLLDTDIISEMRKVKSGKANANLIEWLARQDSSICTSVVVMMELEQGILGVGRKDPQQGRALRVWFDSMAASLLAGRILPIDETTAVICAKLHIPDRSPENDAWIAATTKQHGLILVTRNTKDFEHSGVKMINPFDAV